MEANEAKTPLITGETARERWTSYQGLQALIPRKISALDAKILAGDTDAAREAAGLVATLAALERAERNLFVAMTQEEQADRERSGEMREEMEWKRRRGLLTGPQLEAEKARVLAAARGERWALAPALAPALEPA